MALLNKLVRFAHKPLPDQISAIRATIRQASRVRNVQAEGMQYQIPDDDYASGTTLRPRLAIVGCGWFAREAHIPALRKLERTGAVELAGLCSRSDESVVRANARYGSRALKHYHHLDAVLADPDIDIVDLVLPIATMPAAIEASLRAGKHVISEKPCAPSVAQCLALLKAQSDLRDSRLWAVAENWRFKGTTRLVERMVKDNKIGTIYFADFNFIGSANASSWRRSPEYQGGDLLDSGVHFIAFLRQVVGEVDVVSAAVSQHRADLRTADSVVARLTFASGAQGSFRLSVAAPEFYQGECTLILVGSDGTLHVDFFGGVIRLRTWSGESTITVPDDPWVEGGVHELLGHCLASLRYHSPLRCSPDEALRDVAVIEAILESGRTGQPATPASLYPAVRENGREIATFSGVLRFRPNYVADCGSVAEVQRTVAEAASAGLPVRPMGVAYSWGPELLTQGVTVRLTGLNYIRSVDKAQKTVVVDAGTRLGDLTRVLAQHGLALPSLTFIKNATIGGAVASGSHGSSPRWGTLSDFVRSATMVLPSGDVRQIGPDGPFEELQAARVAVGMLGVIVSVELEAINMPWVRPVQLEMPLSRFVAEQPTILSRYDYIWGHWTLGDDKVQLACLEVGPQGERGFEPYIRDEGVTPAWTPRSILNAVRGSGQAWVSCQYGVPLSQIESAIACIRTSAFAGANVGRVVEIKFLKGESRSFLGYNAAEASVLFNIWWSVDEDRQHTVFDGFEDAMRSLHGKPHWGKFHRPLRRDYVKDAFPYWKEFDAVRSRFDPDGIFSIFSEHRS